MVPSDLILSQVTSKRIISIPVLEKNDILAKISTRDHSRIEDFLNTIKIDPASAVMADQVHGDVIKAVNLKQRGAGFTRPPVKNCDAMFTNIPSLPLVIRTADCIPMLIFEPKKRIIGIVHIGWRGSILRMAEKAIKIMAKTFKILPRNCIIVLGPFICSECYEVDDQVVRLLKKRFRNFREYITAKGSGHWLLDLQRLNMDQLKRAGIKEKNIHAGGHCTNCGTDIFYSYRKEGAKAGRNFSVIMLNK